VKKLYRFYLRSSALYVNIGLMFLKLKNRIEVELTNYIRSIDKLYSLRKNSPLIFRHIKDFILRRGKRLRPILFILGYLGFAKKAAAGLYQSAISLELLHDFMLIHDDIIDKAITRRGKPSMHELLNKYLAKYKNIKFNGQDLAIITGDIVHTLAIQAFLSIAINPQCKERALKKLLEAAVYTEKGEFMELLAGLKSFEQISKTDIYKIYDYKTAAYSFAFPLTIGATLAHAKQNDINKLFACGIYLGRAFQIKDDILNIFAEEQETGKPTLSDLQEAKKTILIWYAYHHANKEGKLTIRRAFTKNKLNKKDLLEMQEIILKTGSLSYAKKEISNYVNIAQRCLTSTKMYPRYKKLLLEYSRSIINI